MPPIPVHRPARRPWRRGLLLVVWLLGVLALAEGAVRTVAIVRRREASLPPPRAGASVIYCIGDSFTYGQGVQTDEAWPEVLARLLLEDGADALQVRSLAEPGRSSSVVTELVAERLKAGDARLLLILTGWNANDGDFAAYAAARKAPVPWTTTADLWLQHSRLYKVAKQALTYRSRTLELEAVKVIPQTTAMSLYDFRAYQEIALENLTTIARLCRAAAVPCAFLTYPHQDLPPNPYTRTEYYHALFGRTPLSEADYLVHDRQAGEIAIDAVIRRVGQTEGLPVIDLQPPFRLPHETRLFLADLHHPTAAGHQLIARAVFAAIREMLQGQQLGGVPMEPGFE